MNKSFTFIFFLIGVLAFGQENNLDRIIDKVDKIESNAALILTEYDLVALTGITTDGGGILKVWRQDKRIYKIVEQIGYSYGRITTIIYFDDKEPIKIIETEEHFEKTDEGLNYTKLEEVYKEVFYIFDWEMGDGEIKKTGQRYFSEGSCSHFDYESIIEYAQKAINK